MLTVTRVAKLTSNMATAATTKSAPPSKARVRALVIPREHGAWGLLLIPLITGASAALAIAHNWLPLAEFTVAALALFWMRTPLESALGTSPMRPQSESETNWLLLAIAVLGSLAMVCIIALLWDGNARGLLLLGGAAALCFVAQAVLKKFRRTARMAAQLIGAIGLTATAPAAWYVVTERLDATALGLWLANWIFAGNQVHFVQLRIHAARAATFRDKLARGRSFLIGQLLMCFALAAAWHAGLIHAVVVLAFVPVLVRGFLWFTSGAQPLLVKRLGWTEVAHGIAFGVLLIAAYLV